jgi:hypothetical protein
MAARTPRNSNLAQAIALLIQNQAAFVADMRDYHRQMAEIRREFDEIKAILIRHEHILMNLPEAIREKIGFQARCD